MKEIILNPSCSTSVMRVRVTDMDEDKKEALLSELDDLVSAEGDEAIGDTYVRAETIWGVPSIVLSGDGPHGEDGNSAIRKVLKKHKIKDEDIEEDDD